MIDHGVFTFFPRLVIIDLVIEVIGRLCYLQSVNNIRVIIKNPRCFQEFVTHETLINEMHVFFSTAISVFQTPRVARGYSD